MLFLSNELVLLNFIQVADILSRFIFVCLTAKNSEDVWRPFRLCMSRYFEITLFPERQCLLHTCKMDRVPCNVHPGN